MSDVTGVIEEPFEVAVEGGRLAGFRSGEGPPALVLHGGPGMSDYTEGLADELHGLFEVIRFTQRGNPPSITDGPFTVEQHMDDAISVLDGLGIDRVWLVGHSWGGHLALHMLPAHADRLLGAVIVDPLGALGNHMEEFDANLTRDLPPDDAARADELDRRAMAGEGTEADAVENMRLIWPAYFADRANAPPMPPLRFSVPCYSGTFASVTEHFAAGTLRDGLGGVRLPVAFVHGRDDPLPSAESTETAALIPGATVEIVATGHFPWIERPGCLRAACERLLLPAWEG
jgi:pimeloyl-ACP methyl ester carboxylesterase